MALEILIRAFSPRFPKGGFEREKVPWYAKETAEFSRIHHPVKVETGYLPEEKRGDTSCETRPSRNGRW